MSDRPSRYDWSWRRGDLITLTVLAAAALPALVLDWPSRTPCPEKAVPIDRLRVARAAERLDPNTASAASLRRLPMIGPAKARAIIAYRSAAASQPAFCSADDLAAVSGIGPATVERLRPYLWSGQ